MLFVHSCWGSIAVLVPAKQRSRQLLTVPRSICQVHLFPQCVHLIERGACEHAAEVCLSRGQADFVLVLPSCKQGCAFTVPHYHCLQKKKLFLSIRIVAMVSKYPTVLRLLIIVSMSVLACVGPSAVQLPR
jgi:hypothetical protein